MSTNSSPIQTKWYTALLDASGRLRILDKAGKVILSSTQYAATYGEVYCVLYPLREGDQSILLDHTDHLHVGDVIQIRNEFRRGFMNRPLIHEAIITDIGQNNKVYFKPSVPNSFCEKQSVSKKLSLHIRKVTGTVEGFSSCYVRHMMEKDEAIEVEMVGTTPYAKIIFHYTFSRKCPEIEMHITTRYKDNVKVFNESLLYNFAVAPSAVYRKNRKLDSLQLQKEYWLDKQGCKFGKDRRSALIYHTPGVSSLQLKTRERQLIIHLDDMHDHRHRRDVLGITYEGQSVKVFQECNAARYNKGDQRTNHIAFIAGFSPEIVPRIMLNPNGYLAGLLWTEHADRSTMASTRAVYLGSEDIELPEDASGGFVKYKIPVTKSVFYSNPKDRLYNDLLPSNTLQNLPSLVAIKENKPFRLLLQQLYRLNYELCLHGIVPTSDDEDRRLAEEAMLFMKANFDTVSWIDHGRNQCNISSDGLLQGAYQYVGDLWEQLGTKYFWQYSSEDISHVQGGNIDLLQLKRGDTLRTPLYWQHPTYTGRFYTWAAIATKKLELYSEKNLSDLVSNWGICINHVYPPEVMDNSYYICRDKDGVLRAKPEFNDLLERIAALRDSGQLNICTVRQLMDYWTLIENIRFEYRLDGKIVVHNRNATAIRGLALAISPADFVIHVDGKKVNQKIIDNNTIIWFDIEPASKVAITKHN
ncbi:hypothetical protein [Paenibacillus xerothermodurans]|uniref:Uncharacterized protein n=1 Tax=Paenibacillus xerothermodurans TaxID=1977292 RepID=A0A2W1NWN3_PAEXE|nr:hypothetical protein [Paenibacillus xerothermodurans]PZE20072.1 hypothetical protein CBW46_015445 [Paenibacillus xerothermodurans]